MYNHRYGGKSHLEVYDGAIQCRRQTVQAKHLAEGAALGNIGLNSITSAKIADRAITSAKIGYGAVEQDNIKEGAVTTLKIGSKALKAWHFSDSIIGKGLLTDALAKEITAATTGLAEVKEELAGAGETWGLCFPRPLTLTLQRTKDGT